MRQDWYERWNLEDIATVRTLYAKNASYQKQQCGSSAEAIPILADGRVRQIKMRRPPEMTNDAVFNSIVPTDALRGRTARRLALACAAADVCVHQNGRRRHVFYIEQAMMMPSTAPVLEIVEKSARISVENGLP